MNETPLSNIVNGTFQEYLREYKMIPSGFTSMYKNDHFLVPESPEPESELYRMIHQDTDWEFTIGRLPINDLTIMDNAISRTHVQLSSYGRVLYVEDLNSENGTVLDGDPLPPEIQIPLLQDNDKPFVHRLIIGKDHFWTLYDFNGFLLCLNRF